MKKKSRLVIQNSHSCRIEVMYNPTDPTVWIVQQWKKFLGFTWQISSEWFNDEQQARVYANELKHTHDR
ncbi:MAG: hypothetical protein HY033_13100 [Ignavibacteriae bacterium]|nr:hypothetical protein [Ignavibacteria bacterium]MBI3365829.1 hypothetical protein [Ignavibacteriota bacterium]